MSYQQPQKYFEAQSTGAQANLRCKLLNLIQSDAFSHIPPQDTRSYFKLSHETHPHWWSSGFVPYPTPQSVPIHELTVIIRTQSYAYHIKDSWKTLYQITAEARLSADQNPLKTGSETRVTVVLEWEVEGERLDEKWSWDGVIRILREGTGYAFKRCGKLSDMRMARGRRSKRYRSPYIGYFTAYSKSW